LGAGPLVLQVVMHLVAAGNRVGQAVLDELAAHGRRAEPAPGGLAYEAVSQPLAAVAPQLYQRPLGVGPEPVELGVIRQEHVNADVLPVRSGHSRCPVSSAGGWDGGPPGPRGIRGTGRAASAGASRVRAPGWLCGGSWFSLSVVRVVRGGARRAGGGCLAERPGAARRGQMVPR